jgi:hypothetical protein
VRGSVSVETSPAELVAALDTWVEAQVLTLIFKIPVSSSLTWHVPQRALRLQDEKGYINEKVTYKSYEHCKERQRHHNQTGFNLTIQGSFQ